MVSLYDFGLVGLGVMGRNFILNVADHQFSAFGLDTDPVKVSDLKLEGAGKKIDGTTDKLVFIQNLSRPRKIMLLVPAGGPVDSVIYELLPHLEPGYLLIDGGNSHFSDTNRRFDQLAEKEIHFMGAGVSGGSKGARFGPSIMPGGNEASYKIIQPIFEAVSAKVNNEPCVDFMGHGSAGNYVKMIHNGIEYGLMQLIGESYHIMKQGLGLNNFELQKVYSKWNEGDLQSFLIEITAGIFSVQDDLGSGELVDKILDKAKQKGTGKWTSQNAMDMGMPIPTIDAAVAMRQISASKEIRTEVSQKYKSTERESGIVIDTLDVEKAFYFAFMITYAQGMSQLGVASSEYHYDLNLERIAKIWRGGCIIRSRFLEDMRVAFSKNSELPTLLLDPVIIEKIKETVMSARKVVQFSVGNGIPSMALANTLNYFDAFSSSNLPLNLIQAQRDYFGSHTYERNDREGVFHSEWK